MSDILLINQIVRDWTALNRMPSGLLYPRSVLRKEGHRVYILDWDGHRRTQRLRKTKADAGANDLTGMSGIIAYEGFRRLT
jgi:hypothetical protein